MASIISASQTPTITAGAYTSGKALGGLLTFSGAANGGSGKLITVTLSDKANQKSAIDLVLFSQTFTSTADAATIAISAADLANCIGVVSIAAADYVSLAAASNAIATKLNLNLDVVATADNNIYGQLVCRGTPTYASTSDVTVKVVVEPRGNGA